MLLNQMICAGEIIYVAFDNAHPCPCRDYKNNPSISKFLEISRWIHLLQKK